MGRKIIFSPRAMTDLEKIVRRIAQHDSTLAKRIGNSLIDRVSILEKFPLIGAAYPRRGGVRKLVSPPYLVFYRINDNDPEGFIEILRYWHGARRDPANFT
jgi:plasmid stabilization system protein ParE